MTFSNAVRAQIVLALRARTPYFLLGICVLPWVFLVSVYHLANVATNDNGGAMGSEMLVSPIAGLMCAVLSGLWGLIVWRDEPPRTRYYHWSLPVDTTTHDLARVVAYLLWLVPGLTAYLVVGMAVLVTHDIPLHLGALGILPWVTAYLAGFTGFFIGAAFSTALQRPVEYVLGTVALAIGLSIFAFIYKLETIQALLDALFSLETRYSLTSALFRGGEVAAYRYENVSHAPVLSIAGPIALWLGISLLGILAASFHNRGRAR
jgi:hypothetical protein